MAWARHAMCESALSVYLETDFSNVRYWRSTLQSTSRIEFWL